MIRNHHIFQMIPGFPMLPDGNAWFIDFRQRNGLHIVSIDGSWLGDGKLISNWDGSLVGTAPPGRVHTMDYMMAFNGWPLFSAAMQEFLNREAPGAIQFLPFSYRPKRSRQVHTGFAIGQLLHVVPAIDFQHANFAHRDRIQRPNGTYEITYPYWFLREVAQQYPIFRAVGMQSQIFVRDDLKAAIEASGLTGCRFDADAVKMAD
jgi:hypothetical protein